MTIQHWQQQLYDRNRVRGGNLLCNSLLLLLLLLYFLLIVQRKSRLLRFVYFLAFKVNERIILAMSAQWRLLSEVISMNLNHEYCDKINKFEMFYFHPTIKSDFIQIFILLLLSDYEYTNKIYDRSLREWEEMKIESAEMRWK